MGNKGYAGTARVGCLMTMLMVAVPTLAQQRPFPLPSADWPEPVNDSPINTLLLIDRLEYQRNNEDSETMVWDAQGWIGDDRNRIWFKTEGEDPVGKDIEEGNVELLYARLVAPFWYLQAGLRHDFEPDPSRVSGAFGIQGLAPYWFEVDATAYLSEDGDLSALFEAEYDFLFTQRLILQPRFETRIAADAVEKQGMGSGFNDVRLGLRLRYEIRREFAPYLGVTWGRKLGETEDLARQRGEDVEDVAAVAGVRVWF